MREPYKPNEYWADAAANFVAGNINLAESSGEAQDMCHFVNGKLFPIRATLRHTEQIRKG
jgi:hypothetical protein